VTVPNCYQPALNTGLIVGNSALGIFTMDAVCYSDEPVGFGSGEVWYVGLNWSIDDFDGSHLEGSSYAYYPQTTATILTLYTQVSGGTGTGRWSGADGAGSLQSYGSDGCPVPFAQPGRISLDLTP
jgi:hypothetical protein